ncbi:hypothetical protein BKA56DRAFT_579655 [Ilyonectria sp. MPI-CAGE-AT-0026]|nr:hypothetical protein BKA56DRAFT_579655 [Ilyonectria sp. MPI-CAGE-AT-0026]
MGTHSGRDLGWTVLILGTVSVGHRRLRRVLWTLWTWAWVCVWGWKRGNAGTWKRRLDRAWNPRRALDWTLDHGTPSCRTDRKRERETENKGRRSAQ